MKRLQNKAIVITGSTYGIGTGIARMLVQEGAAVVLSGRNDQEGRKLQDELTLAGGKALFIRTDISSVKDCNWLVDETVRTYGRIDGLINNAGIFPHIPFMETDEKTFDSVMSVNAKGPFFCTKQALTYMIKQCSGSIVNIGTTHWKLGADTLPAYGMSKGALHTMTQHVGYHFAKYGIRCNWVTVGWVLTPGELKRVEEAGHDLDWLKTLAKERIPSGSMQTEEDIAYACVYLLSDESKQVTCTDIEVTGGFQPI